MNFYKLRKAMDVVNDVVRMQSANPAAYREKVLPLHAYMPVDDILKHIKDRIPGIKKAGQVDLLVSKWDKEVLKKHKDAEQVNLTMKLIEALRPNKLQKKRALEIQQKEPVSLEKLKKRSFN